MRLLLLTCGTEGDTRPIAALGHALAGAGHAMQLLADAATVDIGRQLGLRSDALPGDVRSAIATEGAMRDITRNLARLTNANTPAWLAQAIDAGRGCDAVVMSGLAAFVGLSAAEALGVPAIGAMMIPITPTAAFGSPLLPFAPPRMLNRASHQLVNQLVWRTFRRSTNRARAAAGLPPRRSLWTGHPVLYGVSPALLPPTPDWPPDNVACGQWRTPQGAWTPPAELLAFLSAGEPPAYVGFGSMAGFDNARVLQAVTGAFGRRRVLFNAGWTGIDTAALPRNFHPVGHVPHDWLLPRTSLVVHHGGSGTTHSACRAGVPSVVVPFAGDQFFWAARMRGAGVMRDTLRGASITGDALGNAVAFAGGDAARAAARQLGERMRHEDGNATAVAMIERIVAGTPRDGG
ncbi:MAG TPA: glycosyltransferase [Luteimonas sp.]|nr:glycosyltransferase [Luteimonas sp.]